MSILALSVVVVVLAAGFAYYYATTEARIAALNNQVSTLSTQVSTLKASGHSLCLTIQTAASNLVVMFSNITQTLQQQVKNDNSMIATLNSAKSPGYEEMTATLNNQIALDLAIIGSINSNMTVDNSGLGNQTRFCNLVSQP
jgi:ABC-type transporter Mla subunit MlaD